MPLNSKWIIAYGALAGLCAVFGWGTGEPVIRSGLLFGLAIIAAGVAAAQGRTSLRRAGSLVGLIIPLVLCGVAGWRAWELMRAPASAHFGYLALTLLLVLSVGGFLTGLVLMKLRTADRVAERGYSILPLPPQPAVPPPAPAEDASAQPEERARQQQ